MCSARDLLASTLCAGLLSLGSPIAAWADPAEVLEELRDNARFSVDAALDYHYDDFPEGSGKDDTDYEGTIRLGMTSDAYIGDTTFLRMELTAWLTTIEDSVRGAFNEPGSADPEAKALDIRILAAAEETDWGEIVIGKDLITYGMNELARPTDVFGGTVSFHPGLAEENGVWQLGAHYFLDDDTLSYRLLPFHERDPGPVGKNRWAGAGGDPTFFDLPDELDGITISERYRDGRPSNWGHLVVLEGSRTGYDFFVLGHRGPSPYPVIKSTVGEANLEFPISTSVGGGLSLVEDAWQFTGEAIHHLPDDRQDDAFLHYAFGMSYRETTFANSLGLNEIKPIIEYAGEWLSWDEDEADVVASSKNARPGRNTLLGKIEVQVDDTWSFAVAGTRNMTTEDYGVAVGAQYSPSDNLTFEAGWSQYDGDSNTEFGRWRENDSLSLVTKYRF